MRHYPYHTQTNNELHPDGTCNTTSVVMALRGLGWECPVAGQPEDYLTQLMLDQGWSRHSPQDLAAIAKQVAPSIRWNFTAHATWEAIDRHLAEDKPVVVHGYFTEYGHIILITAKVPGGYLCHDPWGKCLFPGYQHNKDFGPDHGQDVIYSDADMANACGPCSDGQLWAHFGG